VLFLLVVPFLQAVWVVYVRLLIVREFCLLTRVTLVRTKPIPLFLLIWLSSSVCVMVVYKGYERRVSSRDIVTKWEALLEDLGSLDLTSSEGEEKGGSAGHGCT